MISQLTIYLPNKQGTLSSVASILADAGINMHSLVIADTAEYGIIRIISDTPEKAALVLSEAGLRAMVAQVIGVRIANQPGGLAKLLHYCDENGINIEYGYCFLDGADEAIDVLKIDGEGAEAQLVAAGFDVVQPEEIYETD